MVFTTCKLEYLNLPDREKWYFGQVAEVARKEGLDYLLGAIEGIEMLVNKRSVDTLWMAVRILRYRLQSGRASVLLNI